MGIHPLVRCLALPVLATSVASSPVYPSTGHEDHQPQHLGVVVYTYRNDLGATVASLSRWPSSNCSPLTQKNVDLILYYGESEEDSSAVIAAADTISQTAGSCFATTRIVYADLTAEDDVYPKGPSVMFYKMFLDEDVRSSLSEYDALAILEWDVLVASDRSFEQLYHAAFRTSEDFWVKGSNLEGTSLHSSAEMSDMWHVLGHINGNAIYNNNDPAFVEYVDYTRARWQYDHPYDVALWLTISDFPYSWPLYQRYSNKFVVTNLISYVGNNHIDHDTVTDAVAGQTLFIHGRNIDDGSKAALKAVAPTPPASTPTKSFSADRKNRKRRQRKQRRLSRESTIDGAVGNTMMPPASETSEGGSVPECSDKCFSKKNTVCDPSCGTGMYGDYNCGWKKRGSQCRFCFDDLEAALMADEVAAGHGGRVVMCSTLAPPTREDEAIANNARALRSRHLQKWRDNEKWKTLETPKWETEEKWRGDDEEDAEPKWQVTEKWRTVGTINESIDSDDEGNDGNDDGGVSSCTSGCDHTNSAGTRGRVCDENCSNPSLYGTQGCSARSGIYGANCRVCYIDEERALSNDSPGNRAIMCATVEPVIIYSRRLSATAAVESANRVERMLHQSASSPETKGVPEADPAVAFFTEAAQRPFVGDVTRGNLCGFVAGRADEAEMWEVTAKSILQFVPGMRVAIAVESAGFEKFERLMGGLPGVTVSRAEDLATASLFADQYCGLGTSLILYLKPGSVLSRSFTSKDTHSPQGDLLVVYGGAQGSYHDTQLSRRTASLLGVEAPSFTHGTDLLLPADVNAELRGSLGFGWDNSADGAQRNRAAMRLGLQDLLEFDQVSAVPQMLAALAYSRDMEGVWFLDPQDWVSHNLFKDASIWEIPLVKPRYTCTISPKFLESAGHEIAGALQNNLDFFARGGKCDNGVIDFVPMA